MLAIRAPGAISIGLRTTRKLAFYEKVVKVKADVAAILTTNSFRDA